MQFQAGARITIHETYLRGLVDEYGQDVSPNKYTQISVQEVKYENKMYVCIVLYKGDNGYRAKLF